MTESDEIRRQVGERLARRRVEISQEYRNLKAFARDTGMVYKTLQRIEKDIPHRFAPGTLLALDRAYRLEPGSIEAMLAGGEGTPLPLDDAPRTDVPTGQRPPIEQQEPVLRLSGQPPLREGETLTAWTVDESHWYHRFETTIHGTALPVTTVLDRSLPIDEAVRRLRTMARVATDDM